MGERLDVKATAANDDGQLAPRVNSVDGAKRELSEFCRVHFLQDRHRPDQVMRNFGESSGVRLRGEKIKPAIDLKCVSINYLRINPARHIGGELGFSDGSRTHDEKGALHE
jgi:hypothetical protein